MPYKVDLHTHSILSHDGSISIEQYKKILDNKVLDFIAVTDHNEIDMALEIHNKIGNQIIVGEEVKTLDGDLIGLFINKKIPKGLSLGESIHLIKDQGGLVYVPHPFDIRRSGLNEVALFNIIKDIDIFEVFNSRFILPKSGNDTALAFQQKHSLAAAVGTDSHSYNEVGKTYNVISEIPTVDNLTSLLKTAEYSKKYVTPLNFLSAKRNIISKFIKSHFN